MHLTHKPSPCDWLPVCVPKGSKNELSQTASEHPQKAGPNLKALEKPQNGTYGTARGKAKWKLAATSLALQDRKKAYKLTNSATKDSKKCRADVLIGKV